MNKEQVQHEIQWLLKEVEKVKEQIKKRSSKWRHLKDLERQIEDRRKLLGTTL